MTPQEAAALLAVAAAFDNRKPDPDTATAWSIALNGLRAEDCRQAIVEHARESHEYLDVSHIIERVRKIRADRVARHAPLVPPPEVDQLEGEEFDRAYAIWHTDQIRRIGDGEVIEQRALPPSRPMPKEIRAALPPRMAQAIDDVQAENATPEDQEQAS